ncbi:hypothetical protein MKW98_030811, partial [Papaver atlanticum]
MGLLIQDINTLALTGHLDWRKTHAFDHFMGSMILCKFAAMVLPERLVELKFDHINGNGSNYGSPYECQLASLLGGAGV